MVFLRGVVGALGMNVKKTKTSKIKTATEVYLKSKEKQTKLYTTKLSWNKRRPKKFKAWAVFCKDKKALPKDNICDFIEFESDGSDRKYHKLAIYKFKKHALEFLGISTKYFDIIEVEIVLKEKQ